MIQAMYPGLTKLALFCRGKPRDGWDSWDTQSKISLSAAFGLTRAGIGIMPLR